MTARPISPLQLAFLLFATTFAGAAVSHAAIDALSLTHEGRAFVSRAVTLTLQVAMLLGIAQLRHGAARVLEARVAHAFLGEVCGVLAVALLVQFARFGVLALARWMHGGDTAVAIMQLNPAQGADGAWTAPVVRNLLLAGFITPVVEELLFRGALYGRLMARHSTLTAMLLTSLAFGLCHDDFLFAFAMGVLLNSVYIRTGSLRAAILVHSAVNLASWYPLLGQFLIPRPNDGIRSWSWQLACVLMFAGLTIAYALLARRRTGESFEARRAPQSP